ncbi:helix-turn-helix domain-containing protein [Sinomonas sp. JGH33]|uniref:Helix-turn-helix domain-containing protein n=1 Tax=Sinomonas terricola TaxID=3110330 RepID=A0ABU5TB86_9MICC|nr:helix-turn-helix domain-containing protein [Sinomonas sp. JGH33]MEA5456952.1 helix-turn-helix domain-containing protein [Sinomonas sp. JGH33]
MRAFGINQARAAILRYLAQDTGEGCTSGQIARDLKLGSMTAFRHLTELESLGIVVTDGEEGPRSGLRLLYRLNKERLAEEFANLGRYLNGE